MLSILAGGVGYLVAIIVVIHGGSWEYGERGELAPLNTYLAQRGYVVATVSYRLAPAYPFPAARNDISAAIMYLQQHASQFGIDATHFVLLGRSAGGQLALLTAHKCMTQRFAV